MIDVRILGYSYYKESRLGISVKVWLSGVSSCGVARTGQPALVRRGKIGKSLSCVVRESSLQGRIRVQRGGLGSEGWWCSHGVSLDRGVSPGRYTHTPFFFFFFYTPAALMLKLLGASPVVRLMLVMLTLVCR